MIRPQQAQQALAECDRCEPAHFFKRLNTSHHHQLDWGLLLWTRDGSFQRFFPWPWHL